MNNIKKVGLKNTPSKKRVNITVRCERGVSFFQQTEQTSGTQEWMLRQSLSMTKTSSLRSLRALHDTNHVYQINHTNHSSDNKIATKSEIQKIIENPGKKFHFKHEGVIHGGEWLFLPFFLPQLWIELEQG